MSDRRGWWDDVWGWWFEGEQQGSAGRPSERRRGGRQDQKMIKTQFSAWPLWGLHTAGGDLAGERTDFGYSLMETLTLVL